jgi:hypothetical protein
MQSKVDSIQEKFYNTIDKQKFYEIIRLDPTASVVDLIPENLGKYSKWLLNAYRSGKVKEEDFYKITDCLRNFEKNKILNLISKEKKDINHYSSLGDLLAVNKTVIGSGKATCSGSNILDDRFHVLNGNATIKFEDEHWLIVQPHNHSAALFYSHNSQWCTKMSSTFDYYNRQGRLEIYIDKKNIYNRYQFHPASGSFADINDKPISQNAFLKKNIDSLQHLIHHPTFAERQMAQLRAACRNNFNVTNLSQGDFLKALELGLLSEDNASVQARLFKIERHKLEVKPKPYKRIRGYKGVKNF